MMSIRPGRRILGRIHTSGGPNDWREVHDSMRARGYFRTTEDSLWHAPDGTAAAVYPDGTGCAVIVEAPA